MVLAQLVKREIKVFLRNPAFLISIVVLVVFYGILGGIARRGVEEAAQVALAMNIGVVLEEDTPLTREVVRILNELTKGRVLVCKDLGEAVERAGLGILIAKGFTDNATNPYAPLFLEGLIKIDATSQISVQVRLNLIAQVRSLVRYAIGEAFKNVYGEELYRDKMVYIRGRALFYGREVDSEHLLSFISFISFLPLLISIVVGPNVAYASQLVALEKVEKAFELLLSQPIKRSRIVLAKIIGASIASMIIALAYLAGLILLVMGFAYTLPTDQPATAGGEGFLITIGGLLGELGGNTMKLIVVSTGVTLLLGLYSSGALGIILGSISTDERTAGILTTPVTLVYFGIAFALIFMGIEPNLTFAVVSGMIVIPIPALYVLSSITGQPIYGLISVAVAIFFSVVLTMVATYIFNRDIVILGLKLNLRKTRSQ
ncbi:MAG: ABC transporter permease [Desulfurococcaceae archaeon]